MFLAYSVLGMWWNPRGFFKANKRVGSVCGGDYHTFSTLSVSHFVALGKGTATGSLFGYSKKGAVAPNGILSRFGTKENVELSSLLNTPRIVLLNFGSYT